MSKFELIYELNPKIYKINSDAEPLNTKVNGLRISEIYKKNEKNNWIGDEFGDYQITIKKSIRNNGELQDTHFEITSFIEELDKAWIYSCGHPLSKKNFSLSTKRVTIAGGKLSGWKNNYQKVQESLDKGVAHAKFKLLNPHWAYLDNWPLETSLEIRTKILESNEQIQSLVNLHYFARMVDNGQSRLFLLAKSLELVRSLLPGKDDNSKQKQLPEFVRKNLLSSFKNIMSLANNRYEIRHIVKNPKTTTLHERLSSQEIEVFLKDSDLIIKGVVTMMI